jgi:hypothetical protein
MPNKLPFRLFNIKTMTVVIDHDFPESVFENGYVAVSHVWGEQISHTPESLGVRGGVDWEIPLSDARKIDMLKAAMKKFKIEWCWWDVLCMPQGEHNQAEVNKEISHMGDYYNGAMMTLVLSDYKDSGESSLFKGMTAIAKYTSVGMHLIAWDFEGEPWLHRLWTFQEAVMSKQIWLVGPSKNYLDVTDSMKRVAISDEKYGTNISAGPITYLARSIRDYTKHKTSVGRMLYECRNRKCYKPQDRYYGMLGVLGYAKFPVTYDIAMEDLGRKFMEHAYYNRDISWLAIHTVGNTGFIPTHENITYIGELWREEKPGMCDIKFGQDTLWINACIAADVTDSKIISDDADLYDFCEELGFDESDAVRAIVGHCKLSDGEVKSLKSYRKYYDAKDLPKSLVVFGSVAVDGNIYNLLKKGERHLEIGWQAACKIVCMETKKDMLLTICGECDVGDKIMLLPMYDIHGRTLGMVVDSTFKRKGICLYPKLDVLYEYTPYEFPL